MTRVYPTHEKEKKRESKSNVEFYMRHLSLKELKVLEELALQLATNYSESYREWQLKRG